MCGLCGMLSGGRGDGTEASLFDAGGGTAARRRERHARVRLLNEVLRHYGVRVDDFAGAAFVLRNRTGRTELASSVQALWSGVERLSGRPCDPFDPALLASLDQNGRA